MRPLPTRLALALAVAFTLALVVRPALAQQRVVHGRPGALADLRATVALIDPEGGMFCTGTLVAPDVVATAAHCLANELQTDFQPPEAVRVAVGRLDVISDPGANLAASVAVRAVHPACGYLDNGGYGPGPAIDPSGLGRGDDIAFLRLEAPVAARVMTPVPILPAGRREELTPGTRLTVTGYGLFDLAADAGGLLYTGETEVQMLSEHELLTRRDPSGQSTDSCFGDSGGPLYYTDAAGETFLVGVTSRGAEDSTHECGDGGIYTRADAYPDLASRAAEGEPVACDPGQGVLTDDYVDALYGHVCEEVCADGSTYATHALCRACAMATPEPPAEPTPRARVGCIEATDEGGCAVRPGRRGPPAALLAGLLALLGAGARRRR